MTSLVHVVEKVPQLYKLKQVSATSIPLNI